MGLETVGQLLVPEWEETDTGPLVLADRIAQGLEREALERVKQALGLSDARLAEILGLSKRSLSRLRSGSMSRLSPVASDRLYRLASVYARAAEVLGDEGEARRWMSEPQLGLGGRVPLDLLRTELGAREVENLLGRLEWGVAT